MRFGRTFMFALSLCTLGALAAVSGPAMAGAPPRCELDPIEGTLTAPSITCLSATGSSITLQICGTGTYGAPAGFSVQMKTKAEYDADFAANPGAPCENRGWNTSGSYKAWSLSGQCQGGNSPWNLSSGECVSLIIDADFAIRYADVPGGMCGASGDVAILECGTEYVFRVRAHSYTDASSCPKLNLKSSPQGPENSGPPCSVGIVCATEDCPVEGGCTYTWGYWKTHGPEGCSPGNQINDWDVDELTIGGQDLDQAAICAILHDNPNSCEKGSGADAVLILEHQLIAAMLNVANGAISCSSANDAIVAANALLVGRVYACVGTNGILGQQMLAQKDILAAYNSDICSCPGGPAKPQASPVKGEITKRSSWGQLKSIYR